MLLVNSIKEKVDNLHNTLSLHQSKSSNHFHKKKKNIEGKLLFLSKSNNKFFSSAEDGLLSNEDITKRYTKERLYKCWKEKVPINFKFNHKKFSNDIMTQKVKEAKAYVNNLADPDRFETKLPKWEVSTKADEIKPLLLKQSLFLINNQLSEWGAVPMKVPHVEEGVDSRYKNVDRPEQWNVSTQLIQQEKESLLKESIAKYKNNTCNYWSKNELNRKTQKQFPISEERKRVEAQKFFKQYSNPTIQTKKNYELMNKIKQDLWIEREQIRNEVIHDNPGCRNVDEKINALVEKRMYKTYREKFRVATGKQRDSHNANVAAKNNYHWNDIELINNIHTISNWKDISWFKNKYSSHEIDEVLRQKLLQTLMIRRTDIKNEQELLEEMRMKDKQKPKDGNEFKRCQSSIGINGESMKKTTKCPDDTIKQEDKASGNSDFFEAYKKCAFEDIEKLKTEKKLYRPKSCVDYTAYHPGVYVRLNINCVIENFCSSKDSIEERRR